MGVYNFLAFMNFVCDAGRMLIIPPPIVAQVNAPYIVFSDVLVKDALEVNRLVPTATSIAEVPFFSQFKDITSTSWQKVGCGIASLAMVIDYYTPDAVSVNALLKKGVAAGAYQKNAGWIHAGLIKLSNEYGLSGKAYYLNAESPTTALSALKGYVAEGPVIASVHYKMDVKNPIPHMIVVTRIADGIVHYNDPAAKGGDKQISVVAFQKAWKQKFIVLRPIEADVVS